MFGDNIQILPEVPGDRKDSTVMTDKVEKEFGWKAERHLRDYIEDIKKGIEVERW
jgi:hypothetical protein